MSKIFVKVAILTGLILIIGNAAFATQVTLQNLQFGSAGYVNGTISESNSGLNEYVSAGELTMNNGSLPVYCIDIYHWSYLGSTYTYDREYRDDRIGYLINQTPTNAAQSAGLQLAVWELENETTATNPYSLQTGNFTATGFGDAESLASQYLADSVGKQAAYYAYVNGSNNSQSFASPVPEPASVLTLLMGVSGIAGIMVRKRK
jgi:hypothetical protein